MVYAPIWKDVEYSSTADTLDFVISGGSQNIIGFASEMPGREGVVLNIARKVDSFMNDEIVFGSNSVINNNAYTEFTLMDTSGNTLETFGFLNDWSYEDWDGDDRTMSIPINGHIDPRMKIVVSMYNSANTEYYYEVLPKGEISPYRIITYETTDGNIITPYGDFGAHIISNTYDSTGGTMLFDADVWRIPEAAFSGATTLRSIVAPRTVLSVGNRAFYECSNIDSIAIGATPHSGSISIGGKLNYLGRAVFGYNNGRLGVIYSYNTTAPGITSTTFDYMLGNGECHIPVNGTEAYSSWMANDVLQYWTFTADL